MCRLCFIKLAPKLTFSKYVQKGKYKDECIDPFSTTA